MFPPVDPTRRHLLTVAAGGAVAVVAITTTAQAAGEGINLSANTINVLAPKTPSKEITPSQGIEGDPIYGAIEKHKAAAVVWDAAVDVWAKFPDGPELWSERERIHDTWCDARNAMDGTAIDLINTAPTTLAGIARALNYAREQMLLDDGVYMPSGLALKDDDYPEIIGWIEAFLDTIEHAARELDHAGKAVLS
jgi:hypothetical protein